MRKKLAAALTIAIFVLSTFAIVNPVQAHFTLGDLTGTYRYHANDFDPHVAGPIGYVWPGSGNNAYSGFPNTASSVLGPGYQSPYPGGNPPANAGTPGGAPSQSWYQLESDAYAPFGAVLTGSTGDLIFGLNATCPPDEWLGGCDANNNVPGPIQTELSDAGGWDTWMILIPPEFTVPGAASLDASQITSTLTNSYDVACATAGLSGRVLFGRACGIGRPGKTRPDKPPVPQSSPRHNHGNGAPRVFTGG